MDGEVDGKKRTEQVDLLELAIGNMHDVDNDMESFNSADIAALQIQMDVALSLRRIAAVLESAARQGFQRWTA